MLSLCMAMMPGRRPTLLYLIINWKVWVAFYIAFEQQSNMIKFSVWGMVVMGRVALDLGTSLLNRVWLIGMQLVVVQEMKARVRGYRHWIWRHKMVQGGILALLAGYR